jgi:hypothetical protein
VAPSLGDLLQALDDRIVEVSDDDLCHERISLLILARQHQAE